MSVPPSINNSDDRDQDRICRAYMDILSSSRMKAACTSLFDEIFSEPRTQSYSFMVNKSLPIKLPCVILTVRDHRKERDSYIQVLANPSLHSLHDTVLTVLRGLSIALRDQLDSYAISLE